MNLATIFIQTPTYAGSRRLDQRHLEVIDQGPFIDVLDCVFLVSFLTFSTKIHS
jgi:hypothetical protein